MAYVIRTRGGQVVGTHEGDLRGLTFPPDDTVERPKDAEAFTARLAELRPPPNDQPSLEDRITAIEARLDGTGS